MHSIIASLSRTRTRGLHQRAGVVAGGAGGFAAADPHCAPQHRGRRALTRAAASCALRTRRCRADRDPPRVENLDDAMTNLDRPFAHVSGERGRSRRAEGREGAARGGGREPGSKRETALAAATRAAQASAAALAHARAQRCRVHRLTRRTAPDDAQRDRRGRRACAQAQARSAVVADGAGHRSEGDFGDRGRRGSQQAVRSPSSQRGMRSADMTIDRAAGRLGCRQQSTRP